MVWGGDGSNAVTPGDNPVYMLAPAESYTTSAMYDTVGQPARKWKGEEERLFKNPVYGNPDVQQYEVPVRRAIPTATPTTEEERIFENPVYGQPDPVDYSAGSQSQC